MLTEARGKERVGRRFDDVGQVHAAPVLGLRGREHAGPGIGPPGFVRGLRQDHALALRIGDDARLLGVDEAVERRELVARDALAGVEHRGEGLARVLCKAGARTQRLDLEPVVQEEVDRGAHRQCADVGAAACIELEPSVRIARQAFTTAIVADALATSVRSSPSMAKTSASVKLSWRPALTTTPTHSSRWPRAGAQQAGLELGGQHPMPGRRHRLRSGAHGVIGHRADDAGVDDAGVLGMPGGHGECRDHAAFGGVDRRDAQFDHEGCAGKEAAQRGKVRRHPSLKCFNAAAAIGAPHSGTKCPASGTSSGGGQARITRASAAITGGPSTGSCRPTAM